MSSEKRRTQKINRRRWVGDMYRKHQSSSIDQKPQKAI